MNRTINDIFYSIVDRRADRVMTYKQTIKWIDISSHELYRNVVATALSLTKWEIAKGDRIAIISENRPEWAIADFASLLLGAIDVPLYPTSTAEQVAEMLCDSGARIAFVSTAEQLKKVLSIKVRTAVEKIVVMDYVGIAEGIPMHRLMHNPDVQRDPQFDARAKAVQPEDPATLIYTSGTTGTPKGVLLSHGNIACNVQAAGELFEFSPRHTAISFLPLSHITARHVDYSLLSRGVTIAYCPRFDMLPQYLGEVRPTIFIGVPRVYEKIRAKVSHEARHGVRAAILNWAMTVGRTHREQVLAGSTPKSLAWKIANALVYSKVRKGLGGRAGLFLSGGAPLGHDLAAWFADLGIRIHEGYGLTETSPVIAVNSPRKHKLGTVGAILNNIECKIAEDGEILVRGPSVFKGYWNRPEETRNAFEDDWFKTGDIGTIDAEGFLSITDRKKDLLKTSGGKFIAPQPIELKLKSNPFVAYAAMIGDRRKFASVIIAPHFSILQDWAREEGINFSSPEDLVSSPRVRALYESIVAEVNKDLAQYQTMKRVLIVPEEFTVASGQLTASMKMRRRAIEEKYRAQIEAIYLEVEKSSETVSIS